MQIGINGYEEGKGKDKEALFNVTYYFNSIGHEILCDITKYPFTDTYLTLSSYLYAFDRASTRELLVVHIRPF